MGSGVRPCWNMGNAPAKHAHHPMTRTDRLRLGIACRRREPGRGGGMMPLDQAFQGKKCARCRQAIQSDPACDEHFWYHRSCLEEGTRALQRAHELAARFGLVPADSRTSEEQRCQEASARRMG